MKNTKKILSTFLALMMIITIIPMSTINASADAGAHYSIDNYEYYVLSEVDKTCCIYGYYGGTTLFIPTILDGYSVVEISTIINNIKQFEIEDDNVLFSVIDGVLFSKDKKTLVKYPSGRTESSYIIPDSVTSIGERAFYDCTSFTSITIPDSVTSIGEDAFHYCTSLTSITIPDSVTTIGDYAFYDCTSLTSITIPDSVTSIGRSAFYNTAYYNDTSNWENDILYIGNYLIVAKNISGNYTIKQGVNNVASEAFEDCDELLSITIPSSLCCLSTGAFHSSSVMNIFVENDNEYFASFDGVLFNKDATKLIRYPVAKTESSYVVPYGVLSIEEGAFNSYFPFSSCSNLLSITIPDSVTSIGYSAFCSCTSLTKVTIPYGVTSIGDYTFYNCRSLVEIIIPDSITLIGEYAFAWCENILNINIPDSVESIGDYAFRYCSNLKEISFGSNLKIIGGAAFSYCDSLEKILIPDNVTRVSREAFYFCDNLLYVEIGYSVNYICYDAFWGCRNLLSFTADNQNEYFSSDENGVLYNNDKTVLIQYPLGNMNTSYVVPEGVKEIGGSIGKTIVSCGGVKGTCDYPAFYRCENFLSITIPNSVTSIGKSAFRYCTALTDVYYLGTEKQWEAILIGENNDSLLNANIHFIYTFSIQSPSRTTISKKNGIILHANVEGNAPDGSYVVWTASNNKFTTSTVDEDSLKIISNKNGYTTFTATLYDADGNVLASDSIEMRSKAGFFDVIASWFRKATVYES